MHDWSPQSWRTRPVAQGIDYPDAEALERARTKLRGLPPLVTSWEIERLRTLIAEAQKGKRFLLQGGDCAETLDECRPETITNKLKILLQMSVVLIHGLHKPVIRVGRFAGQYAKPRSSPTETATVEGRELTLPSYFGDLINAAPFTEEDRTPNPHLLVRAYQHASMTINFIRSLTGGGFADLHHPGQWDMAFMHHAELPDHRRIEYQSLRHQIEAGLRMLEVLGADRAVDLDRVDFFTSHEGLSLEYESAQTRTVPRRDGHYDLTTHLPWIGERTRDLDGAHIEFFRGVRNPMGVKIGPKTAPNDVLKLLDVLNPSDEAGKILLITRMGAERIADALPPLLEAVRDAGRTVLWVCDPMHGNGIKTEGGIKTRSFDAIVQELERCLDAHAAAGTTLGGVHFELTGDDVTECLGGAINLTEDDLGANYASLCDPRLNYQQSLELAFILAARLRDHGPGNTA
ncbi:MAG: 3-deoxy-7-phosphoheptulonate synthase class II [Planctomycetota bacterium]